MNFKLLCTDIDGTLLNKERKLSPATIAALTGINTDVPIILISSRMPKAMRHLQQELGIGHLPLIAYNGGLILDGETVLETTEIPNSVLANTIDLCDKTSIHLSLYNHDDWYVPSLDYWAKREAHNTQVTPVMQDLHTTLATWTQDHKGAHKIMAMGEEQEIDTLYHSLEAAHFDTISLYRSKPTYIEIASNTISKETAIATLLAARYAGFSQKDIIAFGDNYNDIAMLKSVGMGVAVANAKQEVLAVADDVTAANIDDGVALSVQKYF